MATHKHVSAASHRCLLLLSPVARVTAEAQADGRGGRPPARPPHAPAAPRGRRDGARATAAAKIDAFADILWTVEHAGAAPVAASPSERLAAFETWTRVRVSYEYLAATAIAAEGLDIDDEMAVLALRIERLGLDERFCAAKLDALVLHDRAFAVAYDALEREAIHETFNEWNRVGV